MQNKYFLRLRIGPSRIKLVQILSLKHLNWVKKIYCIFSTDANFYPGAGIFLTSSFFPDRYPFHQGTIKPVELPQEREIVWLPNNSLCCICMMFFETIFCVAGDCVVYLTET